MNPHKLVTGEATAKATDAAETAMASLQITFPQVKNERLDKQTKQTIVPSSSQAVIVQGQDPLTTTMLAAAQPQEQKQMLGERLFPLIQDMYPDLAGKITGMLLEIDNSELLHMLESRESLKAKVEEAVAVLQAHQAKLPGGPPPSMVADKGAAPATTSPARGRIKCNLV